MTNANKRTGKKRKVTGSRRQMVSHTQPTAAGSGRRIAPKVWWYVGGGLALLVVVGVVLWLVLRQPAGAMPTKPAERANMYSEVPAMQIDTSKTYIAAITTARGVITVELDASAAPQTVNNFVSLARAGFYDGLIFHRVEPGFVIQGGDPTGSGSGGPGYTVPAEIGLPHVEGAIAMARLPDDVNPDRASSGSQFYITLAATDFLDGAYTVFGHVTAGLDVVKSIQKGDVIESIAITES